MPSILFRGKVPVKRFAYYSLPLSFSCVLAGCKCKPGMVAESRDDVSYLAAAQLCYSPVMDNMYMYNSAMIEWFTCLGQGG